MCNLVLKIKIQLLKHAIKHSRDFNLNYPKPIHGFLIIRSPLSHRHQTIPKLGVYSCPPLSLFAWQITAKQYTQFRKTQCRLDRHFILGRTMHDMNMIYCTRTYNIDLKEYIALGRTMWIFRNILHSGVQYNF